MADSIKINSLIFKPLRFSFFLLWLVFCSCLTAGAQPEFSPVPPSLVAQLRKSKPDSNRLKLLINIGTDHLQFTHIPKPDLDSALKYANDDIQLSGVLHNREWHNQGLILKGYTLVRMNRQTEGIGFFLQAADDYQKWQHKAKNAEVLKMIGDVVTSDSKANSDLRIKYYQQSAEIYRQINHQPDYIEVEKQMADVYLQEGQYNEAERRLLALIPQLKALHSKKIQYTYDLLASIARLQGDLKKQLFYQFEVVKSMEASGDLDHAIEFYGHLASSYSSFGRYDQAGIYFAKALAARSSHFYQFFFYQYTVYSANNLVAEHKIAAAVDLIKQTVSSHPPTAILDRVMVDQALSRCYLKLNQIALGKSYIFKAATEIDSGYRVGLIKSNQYFIVTMKVVDILTGINDFQQAGIFLKKAVQTPRTNIDPVVISNFELQQYVIDSANHRYGEALLHFKRHTQIQDSIFDIAKTRKIDSLQFAYETRQKDQNLIEQAKNISALTSYNKLQKSTIQKSTIIRNLIILGLCLFLMLSILLYKRYRSQLRNNALLQLQQQEIDLQNRSLNELNDKQKALIHEKEWLLKEIHHRVKNNLQIVMSLLNSQSGYLKDEAALNAVKESQHRVQAMSLIHQRLYNSEGITDIYMPEYIGELIEYLKDSFEIKASVYVKEDIAQIRLDVTKAVPIGLILNEAITNAFKYAFPHSAHDSISIRLSKSLNTIYLTITDNGPGLPPDFDSHRNNSFGITLMRGMAEDLDGTIDFAGIDGTMISLNFPDPATAFNTCQNPGD